MINVYLDIDGVLLDGDRVADGAEEFIAFVTGTFASSTYWLSGRCSGDAAATVRQLEPFFPPTTVEHLGIIKPTTWSLLKAEAIDFSAPFLWFDDTLLPEDEEVLAERSCLDRLILVDLHDEPTQLRRLVHEVPRRVRGLHDRVRRSDPPRG